MKESDSKSDSFSIIKMFVINPFQMEQNSLSIRMGGEGNGARDCTYGRCVVTKE